ncbi:kinase [Burkholderia sp. Ap-962]|nr:kinase [Burkholderia gladioli]NIF71652.1 kinase [Burkholderia sp. Ap-962]NIF89985.1 kinase [Burkholderia sp. Cy-637]
MLMSEPMRSFHPAPRAAAGISYCSFGELLQGVLLEDESDFLVTLPIRKYSVSTFVPDHGSSEIVTQPSGKTKAAALARVILARHGRTVGGTFHIDCDIPVGKGLSSSSADLLATARAIEVYLGRELPLEQLCRDMSGIEPTDGVMFAESVVYLQRKGMLRARLGRLPNLQIVSLDEGGTLDTLEYHRGGEANRHNREHRAEFNELLERIVAAFAARDLAEIGRVSTRSAQINQKVNPKRHLAAVQEVSAATGGLGLVTAHSGTCIGILYEAGRADHAANLARAVDALSAHGSVRVYDTIC